MQTNLTILRYRLSWWEQYDKKDECHPLLSNRHRLAQIKIGLKTGLAVSLKDVTEDFAVLAQSEPPNICRSSGDEAGSEGIRGKILLPCGTERISQAAVVGYCVGGSVFVPVIVFKKQSFAGGRQHPGAGFILAYPKRDAPFSGAALLHEHEEAGIFERRGGFGRKNDDTLIRLTAVGRDVFEEGALRCGMWAAKPGNAAGTVGEQHSGEQQCEQSKHGCGFLRT